MNKHIVNILSKVAFVLEFCITIMLAIGVALLCLRLAGSLIHVPGAEPFPEYEELLETCFNLIIGVELIRMMYYHTADAVFEMLVFAIAREVIISHTSAIASLIGVCAIAVLFATKKFLFTSHQKLVGPEDEQEELVSEPEDDF